jgi:ADP-ribosyl-[dinitrogen reductase] hydrolase
LKLSSHRAAGVLLGQACADALGVPWEFSTRRLVGEPEMLGGGLGPYAPGEWSDDTQMALCIARVSATGADLTSDDALDAVAEAFLEWHQHGASDIGNQTRRVLVRAGRGSGRPGARLLHAAADDLKSHPNSAGNGGLMRTAIVGLTRVMDRDATAEAAAAMARLTHPADDAVDSCVLWSEAVRRAAVDGNLVLTDGLDLLPTNRRDRWRTFIRRAETSPPAAFESNGWTVTALQAAWAAITQTPVPPEDPTQGSFRCLHLQHALAAAISIGHDTDTVAAIAGGLLGVYWGVSAIPARWRRMVHGWPGLRARNLVALGCLTANEGRGDSQGWPTAARVVYPQSRQAIVRHPLDPGVLLGTVSHLGTVGDAAVSLCRLGVDEVPAVGVGDADHVEFWLVDKENPAENPNLDFVLADIAATIADLRRENKSVLLHCMAAQQRTPSAALAYSRHLGESAAEVP